MLYHLTPLENLDSIQQFGLLAKPPTQTSDQHDPLGVYLSSDWVELLASGTYPEIFDYKSIAVLEVDIHPDNNVLEWDPEYPSHSMIPEYELDFEVRVCPKNIPTSMLSLFGIVHLSDLGLVEQTFHMSMTQRMKHIRERLYSMFPHYRLEGENHTTRELESTDSIFVF